MNIEELQEGQKVYAVSFGRNILPFYGEVCYKKNGNWADRNVYLNQINSNGTLIKRMVAMVTDNGTLFCFKTKEEAIVNWNKHLDLHLRHLQNELEIVKTKRIWV